MRHFRTSSKAIDTKYSMVFLVVNPLLYFEKPLLFSKSPLLFSVFDGYTARISKLLLDRNSALDILADISLA